MRSRWDFGGGKHANVKPGTFRPQGYGAQQYGSSSYGSAGVSASAASGLVAWRFGGISVPQTLYKTVGDTSSVLVTVTNERGVAVDLTNATAIRVRIMKRTSSAAWLMDKSVSLANIVAPATGGQFLLPWASGEVVAGNIGDYHAEVRVTFSDGTVGEYPPNGKNLFVLQRALAVV